MAHEFLNLAGHSISLSHVSHAIWEDGSVTLGMMGGPVLSFTGDDADAVAKALGRHDAKHATAKEAHAAEAKVKAEEKAAEAATKAAEPDEKPKAKSH